MTAYSYKLTEHDPERPWIVLSTARDSVELPEGQDFYAWAKERYPGKRFRVDLEREPLRWAARGD